MQMLRTPSAFLLSFVILGWAPRTHAVTPLASVANEAIYDTAEDVPGDIAKDTVTTVQPAMVAFPDDTADQPYTNSIVSAEDTLPVWNLVLSYTGSRSPDSAFQSNWTGEATRTWHLGDWEPSLAAGWTHSDRGAEDSTLWHLGGGLDWSFTEIFTLGAALDWTPVRRQKDDASAHLGLSGSDQIIDALGVDGAVSGAWDRISRGDVQVGLGISPDFDWTDGRIGGTWDRQYLSYLNAAGNGRSEYLNVWGWSLQWAFHRGKWSTGPTWSGDYWKANASATKGNAARLLGKTRKVAASGNAVDQEFLWNLTWKPLNGIALSVDAFRTTGGETIQAKASSTPIQKRTLTTWGQASVLPQDATGGRATISVSW